jgi:hypothetical protein
MTMDPDRAALTRRNVELLSYLGWPEAHPWVAFCDLRDEHAAELRYLQRLVASVEADDAADRALAETIAEDEEANRRGIARIEDRYTEAELREVYGK